MPKLPLFVQPPKSTGPTEYLPESQAQPDPWPIRATEGLMGALGVGDDSSSSRLGELIGAAAPMVGPALKGLGVAAPLITIFKDAEGVPSAALRAESTQKFVDMARALPHRMRAAAEQFAQDYPRVAAHMRPEYGLPPKESPTAAAYVGTPPGKVTEPMKTGFTHIGRYYSENPLDYETGLNEARKLMYHEGTHAAQALGNKDFSQLYNDANRLVGYDLNPFERTAERAGFRAAGHTLTKSGRTAIDMLKDITALPSGSPAADRITNILNVRESTPTQDVWREAAQPASMVKPEVDLSRLPASLDYVQGVLRESGLAPVASHEVDPAVRALAQALEVPEAAPSLAQHAATSRTTGRLMPKREPVELPEGFEMKPGFKMGRRGPVPEEQKVWRAWTETQKRMGYDPRETRPEIFPEVRQIEGAPVAKSVEELRSMPVSGGQAKEQAPLMTKGWRGSKTRAKKEGGISAAQATPEHIRSIQQAAGSGMNQKELKEKFPQFSREAIRAILSMPWKG